MRKYLLLLGVAALAISCQTDLKERAAKECQEYTQKRCPTPIVNNTSMDSMVFDKATTTLHYYYKFSGLADNAEVINKQKSQLRKMLSNALRAETSMKAYKDAGFNFQYTYRSTANPQQILLDEKFTSKDL
ncbi:MAG: hypothetical protein KH425_08680 [Prevotella bivia]|uniref:hypothetical protein n=1 Tax=Prevotella bivia TaxID=28125 RepID=UPI000777C4C4|nr:hypothetical protein [Prevotella bivia]KXU55898.1 hypothetical protein HMPREF3218_0202240 [Prevotella bivia]MBS6329612.1 hypothetical protein [Prevotella bivia]MDU5344653.1 hypothetical protein [Prevotella bivia]